MAWLRPLDPDSDGRRRFKLISPVDESETGEIACANEADVQAAMQRARAAQRIWGQTPIKERVRLMDRATTGPMERMTGPATTRRMGRATTGPTGPTARTGPTAPTTTAATMPRA